MNTTNNQESKNAKHAKKLSIIDETKEENFIDTFEDKDQLIKSLIN